MSKKHIKTKFVKIKVENAPFLVEKLQVKILPCVISFIDGVAVDRYASCVYLLIECYMESIWNIDAYFHILLLLTLYRLIGFEELGNTDNFSTTMLELRYKTVGVIEDDTKVDKRNLKKKSIFGRDYGSDEGTDDEY